MHGIGIPELIVVLMTILLYGIPIDIGIWVIIAIRRLADGIKSISSRLDLIEKLLMDKKS